ncbi:MAG: hypothetical protein P8080_13055 [Gammaproteobacteria bacterium]
MRIDKLMMLTCAAMLLPACGNTGADSGDAVAGYHAVCAATTKAEGVPEVACKVFPDTIDKFITDENERNAAYVISTAENFYQTNPAGYAAAWRILVDDFGVNESYLDPRTHAIVRGKLNDVIEEMYKSTGVDYGDDRGAFRRSVEAKLNTPEAQAYLNERLQHYMSQMSR